MRCSAAFPVSTLSGQQPAKRPVAYAIAALVSTLPVGPLEIPALGMGQCDSATPVIEARLVSPTASAFGITGVPALVLTDRPLELELATVRLVASDGVAESIASWISAHTLLHVQISATLAGRTHRLASVPIVARASNGNMILRALVRPSAWADAASVTLVSLSLAGRPVPCGCLPATLQVGYNHAPAPAGAVFAAAKAGDVPALRVALDAGGSTEEAGDVCGDV